MKTVLLSFALLVAGAANAQQKIVFAHTLQLKDTFSVVVRQAMTKHYKANRDNKLFTANVIKELIFFTNDSIAYDIKFVTNDHSRLRLWSATATFHNLRDSFSCEISKIILRKEKDNSAMTYVNTAVDSMEPTCGTHLQLRQITKKVENFLELCSKI